MAMTFLIAKPCHRWTEPLAGQIYSTLPQKKCLFLALELQARLDLHLLGRPFWWSTSSLFTLAGSQASDSLALSLFSVVVGLPFDPLKVSHSSRI